MGPKLARSVPRGEAGGAGRPHSGHRAEHGRGRLLCFLLREDGQDRHSPPSRTPGPAAHVLTALPFPGLSVPNVHGALAPLAIPSAAAAAAAAGRIAIPGLAGAGNSVLLVSNLNPEVRASSLQAVVPRSASGGVTLLVGLSAEGSGLSSCWPQAPGSHRSRHPSVPVHSLPPPQRSVFSRSPLHLGLRLRFRKTQGRDTL